MSKKILICALGLIIFVSLIGVRDALCYRVPPEESNVRYLYVFGEDGKKSYGAKDEPQIVFLKVPANYTGTVEISVYDPDVGGYVDEKSGRWNTETRFSIFGGKKAFSSLEGIVEADARDLLQGTLLDAKTFGEDKKYDKKFYHFTPVNATQGEKIGAFRYFKIVAEGLSGDDNNVFSLDVSPDVAEAFSYSLSLRLSERRGTKMMLYPDIPKNVAQITEHNFDVDPTGGSIDLISASKAYKINASGTGAWTDTKINVSPSEAGRRWVYEITKDTQPNANMAMYITAADGSAVPVFFRPGEGGPKMVFVERKAGKGKEAAPWEESKISCSTFKFDGSKSYDPDDQQLTYFWDFGDGSTSNQIRSMHTYKEAGKYLVRLTVTDVSEADCNTATTQQVVKVNQPPCAIATGPGISCINTEISFDGSQSTDSPDDKLTYRWDFGDGETAKGAKVSHKYKKGGDYVVTLTVIDDSGSMCDTGVDKLNVAVNTPPVADAGDNIMICKDSPYDSLEVTFDASKSKDADGHKLTYIWDFGDGETQEGKTVIHKYEKGGDYVAKLLVIDETDTECNRSTQTKLVKLNRAPLADAGGNLNICLTEKADFDASNSFDSDGDALTYSWDFGDGQTATGKKVSHKYGRGGVYKATLTVNDNTRTDCSAVKETIVVDVNSSPAANISADDIACVDELVKFNGTKSADPDGDKLIYTWDFGDGNTASGNNVKHSYLTGGLYKATLFVDDGKNSDCSGSTKMHYVNVNTPPTAEAGPDLLICVKDKVDFDATASYDPDNDNLTYSWDFGDGTTARGPKASHTYRGIGIYKVVLTVTDDSGTECNVSQDTLVATVNAEPVPVIEVI